MILVKNHPCRVRKQNDKEQRQKENIKGKTTNNEEEKINTNKTA